MELLNVSDIFIPTIDEQGRISWGNVSAITRHDPSIQLYEIKTESGRSVTVTESKSLLVWNEDEKMFQDLPTPDVKVGNFVPVNMFLSHPPIVKKSIDMYQLNEENGIFIGLFLSRGSIDNYTIKINVNNTAVKEFIQIWFDKHSVAWEYESLTSSIYGYSSPLHSFLSKIDEHMANFFIADESFIVGVVSGFFSGSGTVCMRTIEVHIVSKKMVECFAFFCNRLGIFGKMIENVFLSLYTFEISAQWAQKFSDRIDPVDNIKLKKLKDKIWVERSLKFGVINDMVLDKIIEITLVDGGEHPKVYDLTIPSTLNFGLANGLQVRDTAKSGYTQRKMVKVLEDVQVKYDGTVRGTNDWVIDWAYGGDGFDRANCSINSDGVFFADVEKIADRINNEYELAQHKLI
jgi:intein/homing endonuclease